MWGIPIPFRKKNREVIPEEGALEGDQLQEQVPPGLAAVKVSTRGKALRQKPVKGLLPTIYNETCVIGTTEIARKDVINYIRGKAEPLLGADYYYGYTFLHGSLSFIATKASTYAEGKLSVFTPAFLAPGTYFYRRGGSFHLLQTEEVGHTSETIAYEKPANAISLNEAGQLDKSDVPKTLYLKWSLKKTKVNVTMLAALAFFVALMTCLALSKQYDDVAKQAKFDPPPPPQPKTMRLNTDMGSLVTKVGQDVAGRGVIKSMQAQGETLMFTIAFRDESDARALMSKIGPSAVYEGERVKIAMEPATGNYSRQGGQPAAPQPGGAPK